MSLSLNVGCGTYPAPSPWINIDVREQDWMRNNTTCLHYVASVLKLPFADNSAKRIYMGHVLEHLDLDTELPLALSEAARVLAPRGTMMIVGPDIDRAKRLHPADTDLLQAIRGEGWPPPEHVEHPGDVHHWVASEERTLTAVRAHGGFSATPMPVQNVPGTWPLVAPSDWQFAICCRHT